MIAIVFLLAVLVLLMIPQMPYLHDQPVPAIFKITKIRHDDGNGHTNYDSRMMIMNTGTMGYKNKNLYGLVYRNSILLATPFPTMNGHDYIPTHHFMVQNLGGQGSCGLIWDPGEQIFIDYKDGTFHPGDVVTYEAYDALNDQIISRHTYQA